MRTYIAYCTLSLLLFSACGNPPANPEKADDAAVSGETASCYRYAREGDTITLNISTVGNRVSGDLVYDWAEKDRNSGKVSGETRGDTLFMDYIFMSEGMESVREEVFLKKDGRLIIGYGEAEEKDGKWAYTDHARLKFDTIRLSPVDCKK